MTEICGSFVFLWNQNSKHVNKDLAQEKTGQFAEIVSMIQQTKVNVISIANTALINLYWKVGKYISDKISVSEWGDGVVDNGFTSFAEA